MLFLLGFGFFVGYDVGVVDFEESFHVVREDLHEIEVLLEFGCFQHYAQKFGVLLVQELDVVEMEEKGGIAQHTADEEVNVEQLTIG